MNKIREIDWLILSNIFLIIFLLIIFSKTNIDLTIQQYFFDFGNKKWLIDKYEPIKKFWFYNLPKILLGILIVSSLTILVLKYKTRPPYFYPLFIFFLGITLIPLTVGNIKKFTNIYCPNQLEIYDGSYPYVPSLESYPSDFVQTKNGECFPAGHAVTGFCLMILFFCFEKKSWRILGLFFGIFAGWTMGFYQMAKGSHFLSDTVISMLCSFLVATIIARIVRNASSE